jgi:hypothetical protein
MAALEEASTKAMLENKTAKHISDTAKTRPYMPLAKEDPMLKGTTKAVTDPKTHLASPIQIAKHKPSQKGETFTCTQSNPNRTFTCTKTLVPPSFTLIPAKYSQWWCTSGNHAPDDPHCRAKKYYDTPQMYKAEEIIFEPERWTSTCRGLEEEEKAGRAQLIKKECVEGPESRDVTGVCDGKTVTRKIHRACWRYKLTYAFKPPAGYRSCEALRQKGCTQIDSTCLEKFGDTCVRWKQTYRCTPPQKTEKIEKVQAFGAIPEGTLPQEPENSDMGEAISKLSVLSEIQKDLKESSKEALKQGGTPSEIPEIFKGVRRACTIAFAGFKNCCTHRKGWGISVGLSKCKAEEIDLAERRKNGLCHEIGGTYCAEWILEGIKEIKQCIRKKRGFCCFPSKLARILHEAARSQLGISWGSAEHPNCRGLTADEIARINFDKLDLSELMADIKVTLPDPQKIQERLKARLKLMENEATAEGAQ